MFSTSHSTAMKNRQRHRWGKGCQWVTVQCKLLSTLPLSSPTAVSTAFLHHRHLVTRLCPEIARWQDDWQVHLPETGALWREVVGLLDSQRWYSDSHVDSTPSTVIFVPRWAEIPHRSQNVPLSELTDSVVPPTYLTRHPSTTLSLRTHSLPA